MTKTVVLKTEDVKNTDNVIAPVTKTMPHFLLARHVEWIERIFIISSNEVGILPLRLERYLLQNIFFILFEVLLTC